MNTRTKITLCAALLAFAICMTALSPVLSASAENTAPVAENLELCTYRNVCVGGRLSALDPDGDTLSFEITTSPSKGTVELTEDGRFVYTPNFNKKGRDYFGYKAVDAEGNCSQEATVIIRIQKQKTDVTYEDMAGHAAHYAAVSLAERGIFTGEQIGSAWRFEPDREISRGEFLALCMEATGAELLSGVLATGFIDDSDIPTWQKTYVATALMDGYISGYTGPAGATFEADACISYSEAAVLMNNILSFSDVSASRWDEAAPVWATQATANLSACGILPSGIMYESGLTRAEAAELIVSALDVAENRDR